jgi:hypothetical protein
MTVPKPQVYSKIIAKAVQLAKQNQKVEVFS